jgi:uncharacterized protein YndB with AHSA1/START domain
MTRNEGAVDRVLGSLHEVEGKAIVRLENRFETPIEDVWSAITDPTLLARWLGEVEGDFRVGGEFHARFFASGWEGTGRVEVCEPPRRLLVATRDANDPDDDHAIEARLVADGGETSLVWEERGMPVDLLPAYGAGIQVHVEDLGSFLAGGERCDAQARFDELFPAYQEVAVNAG